ncbi:MAG: DUF4123 domain-containing protein [Paracoccaceae bacterium]|nr:DUF4123 domain-containing protein [Paracoccaceae bacterium]
MVSALATSTVIEVPPLPVPARKPFWDEPWIAPGLRAMLFDDLPQGWHSYFLADATRWRAATGGRDIDSVALPARCLTDLVCEDDLSAAAPHLLELTLAAGAVPSAGHRLIFRTCPGQSVGIFLRSAFPLNALAGHLARLMLLALEGTSERRFFRYWDPAVLSIYLQANAADAQALSWLFRPGPTAPPLDILFETSPTLFAMWQLADHRLVPFSDQPPRLRARDIEVFEAAHRQRVCAAAMDWVCDNYGDKGVARDVLTAAALRQVGPLSEIGITSDYALRYVLAGFYVAGQSLRQLDQGDLALLSNQAIPQDRRAADFLTAVQARTGVVPLQREAAE